MVKRTKKAKVFWPIKVEYEVYKKIHEWAKQRGVSMGQILKGLCE